MRNNCKDLQISSKILNVINRMITFSNYFDSFFAIYSLKKYIVATKKEKKWCTQYHIGWYRKTKSIFHKIDVYIYYKRELILSYDIKLVADVINVCLQTNHINSV